MTKKEYLVQVTEREIEQEKVSEVEKLYKAKLPDTVQKIVSYAGKSIFFDDGVRTLSYDEIVDAEKDLHVNFSENGIIPLFDNGENDFIVYHLHDQVWSMFNIIDESIFMKRTSLEMLLK